MNFLKYKWGFINLFVVIFFFGRFSLVSAGSPVISIGLWDGSYQCPGQPIKGAVKAVYGPFDIDTFTRDSLPKELGTTSHREALKANAVLIRSVAYYFYKKSETGLCNLTGTPFNLRTSTMQGWLQGRGATEGNKNNMTNDRVTDTGGEVLCENTPCQYFNSQFNKCLQDSYIKR